MNIVIVYVHEVIQAEMSAMGVLDPQDSIGEAGSTGLVVG